MKVFILLCIVSSAFASLDDACGENEKYNGCGTDCPLTCDNYKNPPEICDLMCRIGCECKSGFVRNHDGRCVRPEDCPVTFGNCGDNEKYNECGTDCPLTCDNYKNPPKFCNLMCKIGCECKDGFVLTRDGRCVRPEDCPVKVSFGSEADVCSLEVKRGPCMAYFKRYYFNQKTGKCEKFIYGGCAGNGNNFKTVEQCQETCG